MKKQLLKSVIIGLILLLPSWAFGATYYMDAAGTAANHAAATATACSDANNIKLSIANHEADSANVNPGDTFKFCDNGGVCRDQLDVPVSGTSGNRIIYEAASGETPIINAASLEAGWDPTSVTETFGENSTDDHATVTEDCAIGEGADDNNNSSEISVRNSAGWDYEGLIRIDVTSIPDTATVTAATFTLSMDTDVGANTVHIHKVLQTGWVETQAKWTEYSTGNSWNTNGCRGDGTDVDGTPESSTGALASTDILVGWGVHDPVPFTGLTTSVQNALSGNSWEILVSQDTGDSLLQNFESRTGTDAERPFLSVTFTHANTYEKAWGSTDVVVVEDGTRLVKKASIAALTAGSFYADGSKLYVRCSDNADPDTHTMEVANRTYAINGNGKDYITIDGLTLKYAKDQNIYLNGATNWIIQNNTFVAARSMHIHTTGAECGPLTIQNNAINDAGQESIYLDTGSVTSGTVDISSNTFIHAGWNTNEGDHIDIKANNTATINLYKNNMSWSSTDINTGDASGITSLSAANIYENKVTDPFRYGIFVSQDGSTVYRNWVYMSRTLSGWDTCGIRVEPGDNIDIYNNVLIGKGSNTDSNYMGIRLGYANGVRDDISIYNNSIYGFQEGIYGQQDFTNSNWKNNILNEYTEYGVVIIAAPTSLTIDYNSNYSTQGGANPGNNGAARNWAAWQAAGYEANGLNSNPLFTNVAGGDFTLLPGSPCPCAGVDIGDGSVYQQLHPHPSRPVASNLDTSDFSAGVDNYVGTNQHTLTGNHDAVSDGTISKDNCLMGAADNVNGAHRIDIVKANNGMSNQADFKLTYSFYVPAAQTHVDGAKATYWNGTAETTLATHEGINGTWTTRTVCFSAAETTVMRINFYPLDGATTAFIGDNDGIGDLLYLHNVVIDSYMPDGPWLINPDNYCWTIGAYAWVPKVIIN